MLFAQVLAADSLCRAVIVVDHRLQPVTKVANVFAHFGLRDRVPNLGCARNGLANVLGILEAEVSFEILKQPSVEDGRIGGARGYATIVVDVHRCESGTSNTKPFQRRSLVLLACSIVQSERIASRFVK